MSQYTSVIQAADESAPRVSGRRHFEWRSLFIHVAVCALVCGLAAFIYGQVRHFDFVSFDDGAYIAKHDIVRQGLNAETANWALTAVHLGNWHPLTTYSMLLDVTLFGLDPGKFHLVNAALHALNACLLYFVFGIVMHKPNSHPGLYLPFENPHMYNDTAIWIVVAVKDQRAE